MSEWIYLDGSYTVKRTEFILQWMTEMEDLGVHITGMRTDCDGFHIDVSFSDEMSVYEISQLKSLCLLNRDIVSGEIVLKNDDQQTVDPLKYDPEKQKWIKQLRYELDLTKSEALLLRNIIEEARKENHSKEMRNLYDTIQTFVRI